jgi:hypothetical protein
VILYHLPFAIYHFAVMVIKASAASEVRALIDALGGADDVMREAAIARLAVIGGRAVDKLVAAYQTASDTRLRLAILRALEPMGDRRTLEVARHAMAEGGAVASAATALLRGLLDSPHGDIAAQALDMLVATALDPEMAKPVRLAAFEALRNTSPGIRARVGEALAVDPNVGPIAQDTAAPGASDEDTLWLEISAGRLPADPVAVASAVRTRAGSAALTSLQKVVDAARAREGAARTTAARAEWRNVRGLVHHALARRGSRVALYDLRETLEEASGPLPVSFLATLQVLGDASCLESIASAYSRARGDDTWWRQQLVAAFREICRRERITRRHAVLKRIASRCPGLIA